MTIIVKIDRIDLLSATEIDGSFHRLMRKVFLSGLTETDYSGLKEALDASGVPQYGDKLSELPEMRVVRRDVLMLDDPTLAEISVFYEIEIPGEQQLDDPVGGVMRSDIVASITQKEVWTDINGDEIILEWDPAPGSVGIYPTQIRKVSVEDVEVNVVRMIRGTSNNGNIAETIINTVDSSNPKQLCTEARSTYVGKNKYEMQFTLQTRESGWNPFAFLYDASTGDIIVKQEVKRHKITDHASLIGGRFE